MEVQVRCGDGSDPNCSGSITVDIQGSVPDAYMCRVHVEQGAKSDNPVLIVYPSDTWLSKHVASLQQWQNDSIARVGYFEVEIESEVCGACGSSESYDEEGNNITGV